MKRLDLAQTLGIFANLGVIAGIVFLGIEIRQTSLAVMGATYQGRATAMMQRLDMMSESEFLSPALLKVRQDGYEGLSDEEFYRLALSAQGAFYRMDGMHYQCELGLLDDAYCSTVYEGEMRRWVQIWRENGVLEQLRDWGYIRPSFETEIRRHVEALSNTVAEP